MADKKITIYRFPNCTILEGSTYGYINDSVKLLDEDALLLPAKMFSSELQDKLEKRGLKLYEAVTDSPVIQKKTWTQEVTSFVPISNTKLRELDAEKFEELSPKFKSLYKKKMSAPVEEVEDIPYELINVEYDLSEPVLMGEEYLTDLHKLVVKDREAKRSNNSWSYSRSSEPILSLERNLPLRMKSSEIALAIVNAADKLTVSKGYSANISLSRGFRDEPSRIQVSFYANAYDGSKRKVLETKKDGKPYADRRGRYVKDLPPVVGTASITELELFSWWSSIDGNSLNDDDKLTVLTLFAKKILGL